MVRLAIGLTALVLTGCVNEPVTLSQIQRAQERELIDQCMVAVRTYELDLGAPAGTYDAASTCHRWARATTAPKFQ
jgi:hypothetical protein